MKTLKGGQKVVVKVKGFDPEPARVVRLPGDEHAVGGPKGVVKVEFPNGRYADLARSQIEVV